MYVVTGLPWTPDQARVMLASSWRFVRSQPVGSPWCPCDALLFGLLAPLNTPTSEGETHAILDWTAVACFRN